MDHKRTYRLYAEEGVTIRTKLPRRKRAWRYQAGRPGASAPNEIRPTNFALDQLFNGHPIRILAVLDAHAREALLIVPECLSGPLTWYRNSIHWRTIEVGQRR